MQISIFNIGKDTFDSPIHADYNQLKDPELRTPFYQIKIKKASIGIDGYNPPGDNPIKITARDGDDPNKSKLILDNASCNRYSEEEEEAGYLMYRT